MFFSRLKIGILILSLLSQDLAYSKNFNRQNPNFSGKEALQALAASCDSDSFEKLLKWQHLNDFMDYTVQPTKEKVDIQSDNRVHFAESNFTVERTQDGIKVSNGTTSIQGKDVCELLVNSDNVEEEKKSSSFIFMLINEATAKSKLIDNTKRGNFRKFLLSALVAVLLLPALPSWAALAGIVSAGIYGGRQLHKYLGKSLTEDYVNRKVKILSCNENLMTASAGRQNITVLKKQKQVDLNLPAGSVRDQNMRENAPYIRQMMLQVANMCKNEADRDRINAELGREVERTVANLNKIPGASAQNSKTGVSGGNGDSNGKR